MDVLSISKFLKETPSDNLVYAVFIFISIWLFKEIRNTYQKSNIDNLIRIEKNIDVYSKVLLYISKYEKKELPLQNFLDNIIILLPVCSKRVYQKYLEWESTNSDTILIGLKETIKDEIYFLKSEQDTEHINWINNESFGENIKNAIKRSTVKTIFWPVLYTFFILFSVLIFISVTTSVSQLDTIHKLLIAAYTVGIVFSFIVFINILEFILYKKIINKKKFSVITIIFTLINIMILKPLPQSGGIILILISAFYWYILIKYNLIKKN